MNENEDEAQLSHEKCIKVLHIPQEKCNFAPQSFCKQNKRDYDADETIPCGESIIDYLIEE